MDLNEVAVFVKVAWAGGFSQAARQLDMPNSTMSAKVSSLEQRLGLTMVQKTTLAVIQAGWLKRLLPEELKNLSPVHFVCPAQKFGVDLFARF